MSDDVGPADESAIPNPRDIPQERCCLRCGATFASQGFGERICRPCKSSQGWRNAAGSDGELSWSG